MQKSDKKVEARHFEYFIGQKIQNFKVFFNFRILNFCNFLNFKRF